MAANPVHRPLALVGMPGAGKTCVGRLLAARTGWPFHDTDDIVVAETGRPIHDIFLAEGPAFFRARERGVIARLVAAPPAVIATGGGAMIQPATRRLLLSHTITIWLDASPETLARRLALAPPRPLLRGAGLADKLGVMAAERRSSYAQASLRVDASDSAPAVTAQVLKAIETLLA